VGLPGPGPPREREPRHHLRHPPTHLDPYLQLTTPRIGRRPINTPRAARPRVRGRVPRPSPLPRPPDASVRPRSPLAGDDDGDEVVAFACARKASETARASRPPRRRDNPARGEIRCRALDISRDDQEADAPLTAVWALVFGGLGSFRFYTGEEMGGRSGEGLISLFFFPVYCV